MISFVHGDAAMTTARPSSLMFSAFLLAAAAFVVMAASPLLSLAAQIAA